MATIREPYINKYKSLSAYLDFISKNYNLEIAIHDFIGFMSVDSQLTSVLQPFHLHGNDYCMYIKSNRQLWDKCLDKKKCIAEKCRKEKGTFYGTCHAGVEEYIVPIFHQHKLVSFISAGVFQSRRQILPSLWQRISREYKLDTEQLQGFYQNSLASERISPEIISSLLNIVSISISEIYNDLQQTHPELLIEKKYNSTEDYILHHVLDYIHRQYKEDFNVAEIAEFCHCSESYINHLFKKKMQANIRAYINKLRIDHAKVLLLNSELLIKHISSTIGYNDPNYFCRVFTDLCGCSPSEYKKKCD